MDKQKDKIIQIVQGDEYYTMHGLSERGNVYALQVNAQGEISWRFVIESPTEQ